MRLWSLHPKYLDPAGLVALWREGLLAQAVLRGATRGYRHHPQLDRFRAQGTPEASIAAYLRGVYAEARARGYRFDETRIADAGEVSHIAVTRGQLDFEWRHLLAKLRQRAPERYEELRGRAVERVEAHPLFRVVAGGVATWERSASVE